MKNFTLLLFTLVFFHNSNAQLSEGTYYFSTNGNYITAVNSDLIDLNICLQAKNGQNRAGALKFKVTYNENGHCIISLDGNSTPLIRDVTLYFSGPNAECAPWSSTFPQTINDNVEWQIEPARNGTYYIESISNPGNFLATENGSRGRLTFSEEPFSWKLEKTNKEDTYNPYSLLRVRVTNLFQTPNNIDDAKRLQGSADFQIINMRTGEPVRPAYIQQGHKSSLVFTRRYHNEILFNGNQPRDFSKRNLNENHTFCDDVDYYVLTKDLVEGNLRVEGTANIRGCRKDENGITGYGCDVRYNNVLFNSPFTTSPGPTTSPGVRPGAGDKTEILVPNMSRNFFIRSNRDEYTISGSLSFLVLNNLF